MCVHVRVRVREYLFHFPFFTIYSVPMYFYACLYKNLYILLKW